VFSRATLPSVARQIWRVDADGTSLRQLTHGTADDFAACSPDGQSALYVDLATRALMSVPLDSGGPQRVVAAFAEFVGLFDISADRKSILIGTYDFTARKPDVSLVDFDSGKVLRIFQYDPRHVGRLHFTPDRKGFVYPIRDKSVDNLWLQPLDGGPGRQLTHFTSRKIYAYQWSMDGQQLALVRGDSPSDLVLVRDARQAQ
jgi:Tol biopolymer transport system component